MPGQTISGKAFEYACAIALRDFINSHPEKELTAHILSNPPLEQAEQAFKSLPEAHQKLLKEAGATLARVLEKTEPRLIYKTIGLDNRVEISLQADSQGIQGDVRDILAVRIAVNNGDRWEIGISSKHNHDAVKHPRVSPTINIGREWIGYSCDEQYWDDIARVFDFIRPFIGIKRWSEIENKEENIYMPILEAVKQQIIRLYKEHGKKCTANLLHYLIGKNDFYKAIVLPKRRQLTVQGFNINGTLNLPSSNKEPFIKVERLKLPKKLHAIHFEESSNNKIKIVMDEGWQISMRIHNASSKVENSLKMDVRLEGIPYYIFTHTEGF
jgi:hypothetical protein